MDAALATINAFLWHDYVLYTMVITGLLFTLWSGFSQYRALMVLMLFLLRNREGDGVGVTTERRLNLLSVPGIGRNLDQLGDRQAFDWQVGPEPRREKVALFICRQGACLCHAGRRPQDVERGLRLGCKLILRR